MVEVVLGLGFADYGDVEGWEGGDCVVEGGLVAHFENSDFSGIRIGDGEGEEALLFNW